MPELIEIAKAIAARAGEGEQIEAYLAAGRETEVRSFEQSVENLSQAESSGVGVRVVRDSRQGFAWVGSLDAEAAGEALAEARDNATYATEDEHAGLPVSDGWPAADLDLWSDELAGYGTSDKVALAIELERELRADRRIRQVVRAGYTDASLEWAVANSRGLSAASRRSSCHLFAYAIAGEGDDTATGFGYSVGRSPSELDLSSCAGDTIERATRMVGAEKPKSAQLTVVLDRRVTATLLSIVAGILSGEEVSKGRSLFANRVGEAVAAPSLTLLENPTDPEAMGASPFDSEGLATRRVELIEGGKLMGYLYDSRAARVAGSVSTGSAIRDGYRSTPGVGARAVSLLPGELGQQEILSAVGEGLFVQSIAGVHSGVNAVSGDFSVGAEGLMIRGGELAEPVREMTIASTIQRMLQHVVHIGSDLEWLPGRAAGLTLAIEDVSLGGG